MQTNDTCVTDKVDSGAQVNVITETEIERCKGLIKVRVLKVPVNDCNGGTILVLGECILTFGYKVKQQNKTLYKTTVLGTSTCKVRGHIKRPYTEKLKDCTGSNLKVLIASFENVFPGNMRLSVTCNIELRCRNSDARHIESCMCFVVLFSLSLCFKTKKKCCNWYH